MVLSGTAGVKQLQRTCIFCAFHNNYGFLRASRSIHVSRRNLKSAEALAKQEDQDLGSTDLFTARYSSSDAASKPAVHNNQSRGDVYGARYASKEAPSWRKRKGEEQRHNLLERNPVSSLKDASSSSQQQPPRTHPYTDNSSVHQPQSGSSSFENRPPRFHRQPLERRGNQSSRTQHHVQLTQPLSSDERSETQKIAQKSNAVSPPETFRQPSRGAFRRIQVFTNAFTGDEFQDLSSSSPDRHSLSAQNDSQASRRISEAWEKSPPTDQAQREQHKPKWTQLTSRSKSSSKTDSLNGESTQSHSLYPQAPRQRKWDKSVNEESAEDAKNSSRSYVSLDRASKSSRSVRSNTVGFQDTQDKPSQTSSDSPNIDQTISWDLDPQESSSSPSIKDKRRRVLWKEEEDLAREGKRAKSKRPKSSRRKNEENDLDGEDLEPEKLDRIEERRRRKAAQKAAREDRASGQTFIVPSFISIGNLATALKIRGESFSAVLRTQGFSQLSNDHVLDAETAGLIANELGFKVVLPTKDSEIDIVAQPQPESSDLLPSRPPVVTIMGHVDHGKTTLLDWLRKSSVAASEHGGITQHIGAFTVRMPTGRIITFLDTPGHAAFLEMRARGANVTDIVILVVAADDSVKPQTIEAIKHAKAARTQIVVAISKIDIPEANPDRVKQDLARHGIEVEDYGGDTQTVSVSGKTGEGMDKLEDAVIALADVLDVKADPTGSVEGWVLEGARTSSGKVATVLVRRGTIRPGQIIVAGRTWARIRTLRDEAGMNIEEALPGTPVEVEGWDEQPEAGAEVLQAPNEQRARRVIDYRIGKAQIEKQAAEVAAANEARKLHDKQRTQEKARDADLKKQGTQLEDAQPPSNPGYTEVPIIIRADVSGSVEAVNASILALGNSEVRANVVHAAVGSVTRSDIERAVAAQGYIVSFNVALDGEIIRLAERTGVRIIDGNVIYKVVDEVKAVLEEKLPPRLSHHVTGEADVLQVFEIALKGKNTLPVAGSRVRNGIVTKGSKVKVIRKEKVIYDGLLSTLKNLKKDVIETRKGNECGISFDEFKDFLVGDQIQCYEIKSEKRYL